MPQNIEAVDVLVNGQIKYQATPQKITAAGAVNPDCALSDIQSGGVIALTMGKPLNNDKASKTVYMSVDGGDATLTVADGLGFTTIVFGDIGDTANFQFNGTKWLFVGGFGVTPA